MKCVDYCTKQCVHYYHCEHGSLYTYMHTLCTEDSTCTCSQVAMCFTQALHYIKTFEMIASYIAIYHPMHVISLRFLQQGFLVQCNQLVPLFRNFLYILYIIISGTICIHIAQVPKGMYYKQSPGFQLLNCKFMAGYMQLCSSNNTVSQYLYLLSYL